MSIKQSVDVELKWNSDLSISDHNEAKVDYCINLLGKERCQTQEI